MVVHLHVGTGFGDADSPTQAVLRLTLAADGTLTASERIPMTDGENPGWLCAQNSCATFVGFEDNPGLLQAYSIGARGALEPIGAAVSSVGRHPCFLALDTSGKWLFAANYTEGSVCVCPILPDGSLGRATDSKKHQGGELIDTALHDRQEAAHCLARRAGAQLPDKGAQRAGGVWHTRGARSKRRRRRRSCHRTAPGSA